MPLRIWDTFVVPTDFHAMGVVYAADNGADVIEGANGGLTNTRFSRRAYEYADEKGLALMSVSSDINSANHNYPTNYNEAIYVAGALPGHGAVRDLRRHRPAADRRRRPDSRRGSRTPAPTSSASSPTPSASPPRRSRRPRASSATRT